MANNQIRFGVGFDVDKSSLNDLKNSLNALQKMTTGDIMKINGSGLNEAKDQLASIRKASVDVQEALNKAFNQKLGTYNLETFNKQIKSTQGSLQNVANTFQLAGTQGTTAFRNLANQVTTTNRQLRESHKILDEMAKTISNTVRWNLASGAVNQMTQSIQQAVGYVKALDHSLNDIQIVTGKSADEMDRFAVKANEAAKSLGKTTTDYTDAALTFYQQGLSDKEVQARADLTLKVANASGLGAEDSAEYVTSVLNGYKVAAEDAEAAMDILARVGADTASGLDELAEGMSKVASTANTMGVAEEQLAASLATVISTTRQDASSVGTAFKTIFMRISDIEAGTEDAEISLGNYTEKMAQMGINVLDNTGHLRDLGEVMEEVGNGWSSMSREQQIALARTMAGTRQANNLLALFDNWDEYIETLDGARNATGTLQEQQAIYMESTAAHLNQLKASSEDMYDSLLDGNTINTFSDLFSGLFSGFASWIDSIDGGIGVLRTLGSVGVMVFSQQIGRSINTTISNMQAAKENVQQMKTAIEAVAQFKGLEGIDAETQKILSMKDAMYRLSESLPKEKFNQLLGDINGYTNAANEVDQITEKIKILDSVLKGISDGKNRYALGALTEDDFAQINTELNKTVDELERMKKSAQEASKAVTNIKTGGSSIGESLGEDIESTIQKMESLKNSIKDLGGSGKISESEFERLNVAIKKYDMALEEANATGQDFSNNANLQNAAQKLSALFGGVLTRNINNTKTVIKQLAQEAGGDAQSLVYMLAEAEQRALQSGKTISQELSNIAREQMISSFTKITGAVAGLGSAMMTISNIGSIWDNENLTTGEKIFQTMTNLASVAGTLVMSFTSISAATKSMTSAMAANSIALAAETGGQISATASTTAHATAWKALTAAMASNPIGAIIVGLTALVSVGALAVKAVDALTMSSEEAKKALEDLDSEMREVADAAQAMNSGVSQLEEMQDEYDALSQKAGEYDRNIDNLTSDERDRYNELKEIILSYNDDALLYWNDQGEAILRNNDALKETIDLLKEQFNLQQQNMYNGDDFKTRNEAFNKTYKDAKNNVADAQFNADNLATQESSSISNLKSYNWASIQDILNWTGARTDEVDAAMQNLYDLIGQGMASIKAAEKDGTLDDYLKTVTNALSVAGYENQIDDVTDQFQIIKDSASNYLKMLEYANGEVEIAQAGLEAAQQVNQSFVLGVIKYNTDNNDGWKELESLGVDNAELWIASYIRGIKLGSDGIENMQDVYDKVNEFEHELAKIFAGEEGQGLQANLTKAGEDYANNAFGNFADYFNTTIDSINNLIKNNPKLQELLTENPELLSSILESIFNLDGVELNTDGTVATIESAYTDIVNDLKSKLSEKGATIFDGVLNNFLTTDMLNNPSMLQGIVDNFSQEEATISGFETALNNAAQAQQALNAATAASTVPEFLQALAKVNELGLDFTFDQYKEKLIALASQYETTTEEIDAFNIAIASGNEEQLNAANNNLLLATRSAELAEQYDFTAEEIENYARQLKDSGKYEEAEADTLADLAKAQLRFDRAVVNTGKNLEDWQKDIKATEKGALLLSETAEGLADAYGDLLDIDGDSLSSSFLSSAENLELMQKALEGSEEAYQQLQALAAQDILIGLGLDDSAALDQFQKDLDWIQGYDSSVFGNIADLEVGANLNDEGFLEGLTKMVNDAHMTAQQATDYLGSMGVDAEVVTETESTPTTKTYTGVVPNVTWESHSVNLPIAGTTSGSFSVPRLTYTPVPTTVTDTQETAAIGLKVKSATKASGGGVKFSGSSPARGGSSSPKSGGKKGGGGGGGGSSKAPKVQEKAESQKDPFHDIEIKIKKLSRDYDELADAQERLTGPAVIENLNKQLEILEKQRDLQSEKLRIAEKELKTYRSDLSGYGATFDSEGQISNYFALEQKYLKELNDAIAHYNTLSADAQGEDKTVEEAQKKYDKVLELIEKYDEMINDTIPDLQEEITDALLKTIEIQITKFNMTVEIELDLSEAQKNWNEFNQKVLKADRKDKLTTEAERIKDDLATYYNGKEGKEGTVGENSAHIKDLLKEIELLEKAESFKGDQYDSPHSNFYSVWDKENQKWVHNTAAAYEDLRKYTDQLMEDLIEVEELQEELNDLYLESIDNVADAFDEVSEYYDFVAAQQEHELALIELLYGDDAYGEMVDYYEAQTANSKNSVAALQNQADYWKQMWNEAEAAGDSEAAKKYQENWMSTIQSLNSEIENWAENTRSQYENTINLMMKKLNDSITGGLGLSYVGEELDLMNMNADNYLDAVNAAYALQRLENQWKDSIDATDEVTTQRELNKLMEEQLKMLEEKGRLTQYDIDRAELEYQIALKQIALRESQMNKSTMRLRRDANGNYSYQFVSDQDQIRQAQQELAEAQNNLYNFDKSAYQENLNEAYAIWDEYQSKVTQVYLDFADDEEERTKRLELLQREYGEKINFLTEQNKVIRDNLINSSYQSVFALYAEDFEKINLFETGKSDKIAQETVARKGMTVDEFKQKALAYQADREEYAKLNEDEKEAFREAYQARMGMSDEEFEEYIIDRDNDYRNYTDTLNAETEGLISALAERTGLTAAQIMELADMYEESQGDFERMVKSETALLNDGKGNGLFPTWNSGVQGMINSISGTGGLEAVTESAFGDMNTAAKTYKTTLDEIKTANGEIRQQYKDQISLVQEKANAAVTAAQQELTAVKEVLDTVTALANEYKRAADEAKRLAEEAENAWKEEQERQQGESRNPEPTPQPAKPAKPAPTTPANPPKPTPPSDPKPANAVEGVAAAIWLRGGSGWGTGSTRASRLAEKGVSGAQAILSNSSQRNKLYANWNHKDLKPYYYGAFEVGGYTGRWTGNEGRPFLLHPEEMVLNKKDTLNLLSVIDTLNDMIYKNGLMEILNKIPQALQVPTIDFASLASSFEDKIEQTVHIEANFPGVEKATEIQNAFDNIVNIATQRAYRNRR